MFTMTFGSRTITLRNPDFGNRHGIEVRRIQQKTRGGDLIVIRDPIWPKTSFFEYKFSFLTQDKLTDLLQFFRDTLGQIITVTDHEGFVRQGIIISPSDPVSQEGREDYQAGFKFQVQE
jgi:hypothetical protein